MPVIRFSSVLWLVIFLASPGIQAQHPVQASLGDSPSVSTLHFSDVANDPVAAKPLASTTTSISDTNYVDSPSGHWEQMTDAVLPGQILVDGDRPVDMVDAPSLGTGPYLDGGQCLVGNDLNCCPQRAGFYGGMGIVFARPHFKESFQYSQTNLQTGQQSLFPFDYDYAATPRAWLGFRTPSGVGVMSRYWQFDQSGNSSFDTADGANLYGAHAVTIIFPANIFAAFPGESLTTENSLLTQILELYGTADFQFQGIEATGGVGLRYVQLAQEVAARVTDPAGTPTGLLYWVREFEGFGPSITLDAKRRLGRLPISAVVSGGGAFLFGNKTIDRTVFGDQSIPPAAPFLSLLKADEVVGVGELSVGLEAAKRFRNGNQMLVRGTYEGSLWAEAGAPTLGFLGFQGFGITAEFQR